MNLSWAYLVQLKGMLGSLRFVDVIADLLYSMAEKYDLSNRMTVRGQGIDLN